MVKMLLIDAIYINYGGALNLLSYFVDFLLERGVDFTLLADSRCSKLFDDKVSHLLYMDAREKNRKVFYETRKCDYSSVFCFGNVPPPIRLKVPVYTYFHNINMLTLADCRNWRQFLQFSLKRTYIKCHQKNTDKWFVQTSNTANEIIKHIGVSGDKVQILPFYKLPIYPTIDKPRTDYIFVGEYSGSKGHNELLEAWRILHCQGIDLNLHLTVSLDKEFLTSIQKAQRDGVKIINHGYLSMEELVYLYIRCKATVYPSYNESFGLGLVEAMEGGCDVIASDRPFVYSICQPSEVFEPSSPTSIAQAIIKYENGNCPQTKLMVKNEINEIINIIV